MNTLTNTVAGLVYVAHGFRLQAEAALAENEALRRRLSALEEKAPAPRESAFLASVRRAVEDHLADPGFGVAELAESVALCRGQLHRRLTREGGVTPVVLIRAARLEKAAAVLREEDVTVQQTADACGFNSASYFARCFKQRYGVSPSDYAALERLG